MSLHRLYLASRFFFVVLSCLLAGVPSFAQVPSVLPVTEGASDAAPFFRADRASGKVGELPLPGTTDGLPAIRHRDGRLERALPDEESGDRNRTERARVETISKPLPPNEFQRYVLENSGQALPLF